LINAVLTRNSSV